MTTSHRWLLILALIVLIVAGLAAAAVHATSQPGFCGLCHEMQDPYVQTWQGSLHNDEVDCVACHVGKGLGPLLHAKTTRSFHDLYAHFIAGFEAPIHQTHPVQDDICLECHAAGRSLSDGKLEVRHDRHAAVAVPCIQCHQKTAHAPAEQAAAMARDPAMCEGCHQAHADFPLAGGHATLDCADCHRLVGYQVMDAGCATCHQADDAHSGQLGQDCAQCHNPEDWQQATFDHALSAFPLLGKHHDVACEKCHTNATYKGTPQTCFACHQEDDTHAGRLGQDCAQCHNPKGWEQATIDHALTAFPLTGQHATVGCDECHADATFQGTPQTCFACHQLDDTHAGRLGQDCAVCHNPKGWEQATFDHALSAFPLLGKHRDVACEKCHTNATYKGTPQTCFACHQLDDTHAGRLGQDCAQCHNPEDWQQATFDHALTAFPLTGQHATVDCQQCHADATLQGTPQDCFSCHQADDAHQGRLGQDCAVCHNPEDWQQATFDHALTAFPLTGQHVTVDCQQCHENNVFRGTPQACAACHDDPVFHQGLFGIDCATCHPTDAWAPAQYNRPHTFPINHGESGWNSCQTCHPDRLQAYTCYNCHEHAPARIEGEHREEGIGDFQDCTSCHPTGREEESEHGDGHDDD